MGWLHLNMVVDAFAERHDAAGAATVEEPRLPKSSLDPGSSPPPEDGSVLLTRDRKLIASGRRRHVAVV
jgi:hypothetical protein